MTPRLTLGVLAAAYAALVVAVSGTGDPRAWGVHLPAFLEWAPRTLVLGLLLLGVGLVLWGSKPTAPEPGGAKPAGPGGARRSAARPGRGGLGGLPAWSALLLLPPLVLLLHALRVRTHLLGDGQVWIDSLVTGSVSGYSEPLSSAVWNAYAALLRLQRAPITADTLAWLPASLGAVAAVLLFLLGRELAASPRVRMITIVLLAGLGTSQLYFGYIETYPIASIAILAYLLALQRATRGAAPVWIAAALLPVAVACHLIAVLLVPSFVCLVWRSPSSAGAWRRRTT